MNHLKLFSPSYQYLELSFKEWLTILGFATTNSLNMTRCVREFFYFLEQTGCRSIKELSQHHYSEYFDYLNARPNTTRGGGLSNNYLNKHIQALEKLHEYLVYRGHNDCPPVGLKQLKLYRDDLTVLSQTEVRMLYDVTVPDEETSLSLTLASRDRAILSVYYGCGLRRNEGAHLQIDDVDFDRRILHVKRGKNHKERLVPFSKKTSAHFQEWIYDFRPEFLNSSLQTSFFIGYRGTAMTGGSLYKRLKFLVEKTFDTHLKEKKVGLHTLRHSVATHLLENGMSLQSIQRFLGHASLESTQIYTHLLRQNEKEERL